jgi:hypothetical protein
MPLPPTEISRHRLHQRSIVLEGWQRDDGLWDIEARLVDRKDHDYPLASGVRLQGEAIHDMWIRVTVDQQLNVHDAVASSDSVPYPGGCDTIAPDYGRLKGLNLSRGFRRATTELFESVRGCSHMTELTNLLPTAAIQTFASLVRDVEGYSGDQKPFQLDQCHALETSSETVRRYYPRWFRDLHTPGTGDPPKTMPASVQRNTNNKEDA